jgi:ABC-type branched-subunit amino acid transport system permease subunit
MRRRSRKLHWFKEQIALPILLSMVFVAALSTVVGFLILRRRGVYFSLLTLALAALTYTIAFRWTEVTGGEDGLGGLKRGSIRAGQPRRRATRTTSWSR